MGKCECCDNDAATHCAICGVALCTDCIVRCAVCGDVVCLACLKERKTVDKDGCETINSMCSDCEKIENICNEDGGWPRRKHLNGR